MMTSSIANFYCGGEVKSDESVSSVNALSSDADTESVGNLESPQLFDYISVASSEEDNNGNSYRHPIVMGMPDLSSPVDPKQQQVFSSAPPPCSNNQQLMASPSPPSMIMASSGSGVANNGEPMQKSASAYHNGHHHHHPGSSAANNVLQQQGSHKLARVKSLDICRVCGDGPARMHYGVPTCFGCKGFFRRTLKRTKEYTCRYSGNCVVDRYERNSCRFCRFKRCLEVGMDPKAVRPDRDAAGRTHPIRHRRSRTSLGELDEEDTIGSAATDDWVRKLPVDMRTLLMQIMNIELLVSNGDTTENAKCLYPLPFGSLQQILEDPTLLDGKRTEMRYETYRQVEPDELVAIAHRSLIAVIDMVDHLCALMELHNIEDKVTMVKATYAPLALFSIVAATSKGTKDRNMLCLCSFGYVPRGAHRNYEEPYQFANRLVDRTLDELVEPFRAFNFKEQEVVLMKAIITLNPHIRLLSTEAAEQIADMRDRVQETLYNVVRESHPKEVASSRFGNLLLLLPNIMLLGNVMYENLQFMQSFGKQHIDPLLSELLDNIEPMSDGMNGLDDVLSISDNSETFMRHSQSASSISSMTSHESTTSSSSYSGAALMNGGAQGETMVDSYFSGRRASTSHLNNDTRQVNFQSSASHQDLQKQDVQQQSQLSSAESDPDYNITLTAENLSGMRQAIVQQSMEIDSVESSGVIIIDQQQQRPSFFIDSNMPSEVAVTNNGNGGCGRATNGGITQSFSGTMTGSSSTPCCCTANCGVGGSSSVHTAIGTRHVFTIEPTKDSATYNGKVPLSRLTSQMISSPNNCGTARMGSQQRLNSLNNMTSCCETNSMQCVQNGVNNSAQPQQQLCVNNNDYNMCADNNEDDDVVVLGGSENGSNNSEYFQTFNDGQQQQPAISKSQSYPYVVQAMPPQQQQQQQCQRPHIPQQHFMMTTNNNVSNLLNNNIQEQQQMIFANAMVDVHRHQHQQYSFCGGDNGSGVN